MICFGSAAFKNVSSFLLDSEDLGHYWSNLTIVKDVSNFPSPHTETKSDNFLNYHSPFWPQSVKLGSPNFGPTFFLAI